MTDTLDPLFGSGLHREDVVCTLCGTAWDDRVVDGPGTAEPDVNLCPDCLRTTSHGEPFPEDRPQPSPVELGVAD